MTDVVSTPPLPASPENSSVETPAFWPDIDVNELRERIRIGKSAITHARIEAAIHFAVAEVLRQLAAWHALQVEAGHAVLADVPADQIGGKSTLEILFLRAVTMTAAAELSDRNPDLTLTREGADRADLQMEAADDYRRSATRAIRALQGRNGTTVELV